MITSQPTHKQEGRTATERSVRSVVNSQRQAPPLQPVPRTGPLPLSFAQERRGVLDTNLSLKALLIRYRQSYQS
ncbi:MAG: hypothetical protein ABFS56_33310 [Pseudomonadota bacterium]